MLRSAVRCIVLFILLCYGAVISADGQVLDSAAAARVKDTVDRYYKLHPRRHPSFTSSGFKALPVFGVMYTRETEFVAMGGFTGSYHTAADTLIPLSTIGAVAMLSTNMSSALALTGKWISHTGTMQVEYSAAYIYAPRHFWGLGYEMASEDGEPGRLVSHRVRARADMLYRRGDRILAGVFLSYSGYYVSELSEPELLEGQPLSTGYAGVGVRFDLDTRDSRSEPERGVFLALQQSVHLSVTGLRPFSRTELTADFFCPLWDGGVLATDIYGQIHSASAPWTVWPEAGGDVRLRGYYQGRYRDRNLLSAQVELRQRIHGSHGAVVWGGAGNVFPSFKDFEIKNTLPTYGAGYRFSFLGLVLRLDAGFGLQGQWAVTAGVSHSF